MGKRKRTRKRRKRWRREAAGVVPEKAPSGPPSGGRLAWTRGRAGCRTRQSEDTQAAEVRHCVLMGSFPVLHHFSWNIVQQPHKVPYLETFRKPPVD